ncbi:hypothetical protein AB0F42_31365 [Streptomyces buecherae]
MRARPHRPRTALLGHAKPQLKAAIRDLRHRGQRRLTALRQLIHGRPLR